MPGTLIKPGVQTSGSNTVVVGSAKSGAWAVAHADLTATAESAGVLLRPLTTASANVVPIEVPQGAVRVRLVPRYPQASTITTNPYVRLFGVYGALNASGWFDDDGTVNFVRLDNPTGLGVLGTMDSTNDVRDTTYKYGVSIPSPTDGLPYIDCQGARYIFVLVEQAASISAGTAQLMCQFL